MKDSDAILGVPHAVAVVAAVEKLVALLRCCNPRAEVQAACTIPSLSNRLVGRDLKARIDALEKGLSGALRRLKMSDMAPMRADTQGVN